MKEVLLKEQGRLENIIAAVKRQLENTPPGSLRTVSYTHLIEARTMLDIAGKQIIPAVIRYSRQLADSINAVSYTHLPSS